MARSGNDVNKTESSSLSVETEHTTRRDEGLQVLDIILLLLILLLLDHLILLHCLGVCVKVTGIVCQLLLCQPDNVGAHSVQEILHNSR